MRAPVQMAVWSARAEGALIVEGGAHVSVAGAYRPPVSKCDTLTAPPQIIMRLPVQTAVWEDRPSGPPSREPLSQVSSARHVEFEKTSAHSDCGIGRGSSS